ncbi:MAG: UvrD-helicase domain-containing protein [Alphaproteobacteria bacterium]|nr:UvrD-helicase domain-containing protein [Alphaproteobacteria bacterium]
MATSGDSGGRLRALTELNSCLLVEAAAGTGKTSLLAGRVVMLLASGVETHAIAAITFTELAAGELRQRISWYLDSLVGGSVPRELQLAFPDGVGAATREALRRAGAHLDELVCGTIHGFCHDLLRSYAVEGGIDPGAEVLDGDQADFAFDEIFDRWWRDRLDKPRDGTDDPIAVMARHDPDRAEQVLREFARYRRRHRTAQVAVSELEPGAELEFGECVRVFRRWCDHVNAPPEDDPDFVALEKLLLHFEGRFDPLPDFERLWLLAHPPLSPILRRESFDLRDYKVRALWKHVGPREGTQQRVNQARAHFEACRRAYRTLIGRIAGALMATFSRQIDEVLARYADFKQRAAVLDFDDLLLSCRAMLRQHPGLRSAAGQRFARLLVDEFQDTDPVQAEIVFLLCGSGEEGAAWQCRRLRPGQLFLVGDPKQAIYGFRGADLATYLLVRGAIKAQFPDNILQVTANFRSRAPILDHVNRCFEAQLSAQQAGYVALEATRSAQDGFACVARMSVQLPPDTKVADGRDEEARGIAELCARLIGNVTIRLNNGRTRPVSAGDIALLAPVSTDLWRYERALEEAGLPFASQAGKNLYKRQEAQDLVALIGSLADRRDTLALGALLRGPLVGLTEQDLLDVTAALAARDEKSAGLSLETDPAAIVHPVAREVLTILRDVQSRITSTTPALILAEAIERLRVRAIVARRSADQAARSLANIDGLVEKARGYGVRGFAAFARDIAAEWARDSNVPEGRIEADGRSIEIVTVHSSKGLEWPVVIPINRISMPRRAETFVYRRSDDSLHWVLGDVVPPALGEDRMAAQAEKREENLRLLYVACTRAMELLVIPDYSWSNATSWARMVDFRLEGVRELDLSNLNRGRINEPVSVINHQNAAIFAAEEERLSACPTITWITPSKGDGDHPYAPEEAGEGASEAGADGQSGRLRGVLLHKLMEELITGEVAENPKAVRARVEDLRAQLPSMAALDGDEIASTALRTLELPELEPFRSSLVAEVPIHGQSATGPDNLIAGIADAVARGADGAVVVFDWKSDRVIGETARIAYRRQLQHYLNVLGARRGALVYMTPGELDWVTGEGT